MLTTSSERDTEEAEYLPVHNHAAVHYFLRLCVTTKAISEQFSECIKAETDFLDARIKVELFQTEAELNIAKWSNSASCVHC